MENHAPRRLLEPLDGAALLFDLHLEHSVSLPNYAAVLTLLWVVKTKRSAEEEYEEPYLEELDPEGFTLKRKRWPR